LEAVAEFGGDGVGEVRLQGLVLERDDLHGLVTGVVTVGGAKFVTGATGGNDGEQREGKGVEATHKII
jgi:hypothetical protein